LSSTTDRPFSSAVTCRLPSRIIRLPGGTAARRPRRPAESVDRGAGHGRGRLSPLTGGRDQTATGPRPAPATLLGRARSEGGPA
jgi:hypothetical protein